ncbi:MULTISPECIES: LamG-like jellyroll fold domain-containing protein [Clostridium]|uniref:LamG-like jellyroll fold domain-containing protein n=1 Tax=Clostridium TaxID=1485 RepID=UPI0009BD21BB|nr:MULTISPECIES: LamG-like jellyroll fold domain-containing protein [Clostridium]PJI09777.1 hypothetical protein CUB90_18730 [Clostridium sp. CT7]
MKKKFKVIGLFLCAFFVVASVIFSGDSSKIFANVTKGSSNNNAVAAINTENYVPKKDYSSNLVANYKMDETSGTVCKDSSGHGNDGTYNGTTSVNDNAGTYRIFNGSNDYINFNKPIIPAGKKSIMFRIKCQHYASNWRSLLNNYQGDWSKKGIGFYVTDSGYLSILMANGSTLTYTISMQSNIKVDDDNWHTILFTWDGTTNSNCVKLYIDDLIKPNVSSTASSVETDAATYSLLVGTARTPDMMYRYNGSLADLQIYNDVIECNSVATGITLNKTTDSIEENKTDDTLTATVTPDDTTNKTVYWTSSDSNVVTVDKLTGKMTAGSSEGTAIITATTQDGSKLSATCTVTVTKAKDPTPTTGGNRATLIINMANGSTKQYDLSESELNDFLNWYDARSKGTAAAYYVINVPATGSYLTNKDYIPFDKIDDFKVQEYTK